MAAADQPFTEEMVKEGNELKKIVILDVDGVIQDTGDTGSLFTKSAGYNHQGFHEKIKLHKRG